MFGRSSLATCRSTYTAYNIRSGIALFSIVSFLYPSKNPLNLPRPRCNSVLETKLDLESFIPAISARQVKEKAISTFHRNLIQRHDCDLILRQRSLNTVNVVVYTLRDLIRMRRLSEEAARLWKGLKSKRRRGSDNRGAFQMGNV